VENGRAGAVRFESVPAFAYALERRVEVPGAGPVTLDIGYGGAFYAILPAGQLGLDVRRSSVRDLTDAASRVSQAVKEQVSIEHPDEPDLAFLYGTILTDGGEGAGEPSANVCVFAEREVDRSPTGSGGAIFTGSALREASSGPLKSVIVEVGGRAYYTGRSSFTLEPDDPLGHGFLLR
jgi:trans-L-3-hydroxyproline dehydratase